MNIVREYGQQQRKRQAKITPLSKTAGNTIIVVGMTVMLGLAGLAAFAVFLVARAIIFG